MKGKIMKQMQKMKTYCTICNKALRGATEWHKRRHMKTPIHNRNLVIYCQRSQQKKEVSNQMLLKQLWQNNKQVKKSAKHIRTDFAKLTKSLFKQWSESM